MKWWSRRVTLPHHLACRASALLVCHDPIKLASRPGAAPGKLSFGDSAAQAGARPKKTGNWCGCRELHPDILRGGEAFWLLNHSRKESKKGRERFVSHSRPAPFQQRTNTSCYLAIPTHGFTVVLSVFGGTPPAKPLNFKIRFALSGEAMDRSWAHRLGDQPMLVLAKINLSPEDITWMSR